MTSDDALRFVYASSEIERGTQYKKKNIIVINGDDGCCAYLGVVACEKCMFDHFSDLS